MKLKTAILLFGLYSTIFGAETKFNFPFKADQIDEVHSIKYSDSGKIYFEDYSYTKQSNPRYYDTLTRLFEDVLRRKTILKMETFSFQKPRGWAYVYQDLYDEYLYVLPLFEVVADEDDEISYVKARLMAYKVKVEYPNFELNNPFSPDTGENKEIVMDHQEVQPNNFYTLLNGVDASWTTPFYVHDRVEFHPDKLVLYSSGTSAIVLYKDNPEFYKSVMNAFIQYLSPQPRQDINVVRSYQEYNDANRSNLDENIQWFHPHLEITALKIEEVGGEKIIQKRKHIGNTRFWFYQQ